MEAVSGVRYVEIGTTDVARSLDFYQGLLGFRPVEAPVPEARPGVRWLSAGGTALALVDTGPDGGLGGWRNGDLQRGFRHVGFKVGDVPMQAERLRDAGVRFTLEPVEAVGGVRLAFFTDPDGTLLEIIDRHLDYHAVASPALADREREAARTRPAGAPPVFDHVAVTVSDLDGTLKLYGGELGYEVIGRLDHSPGFVIHYLQAGPSILEVFTFDEPTTESPWSPDPALAGIRGLGLAVDDVDGTVSRLLGLGAAEVTASDAARPAVPGRHLADPDGIALHLWRAE